MCILLDIHDVRASNDLLLEAVARMLTYRRPEDDFCLVATGAMGIVPLTANVAEIQTRLTTVRLAQPADLLLGMQSALREMTSARNRLKAILVVSDQDPSSPRESEEQVRALVGRSDVPVFVQSLTGTSAFLSEIAAETGGYHVKIDSSASAEAEGMKVLIGVRNSYLLGLRSPQTIANAARRQVGLELLPPRGIQRLSALYRSTYYAR
jgi:hypothetical protein